MHRQIAGKLTGRVTKWIVLAAWLIVVIAAGSVASKLTDVQDNQASSWLPGSAESTKALDKLEPFQNQNDIPTVLVYDKPTGLSQADITALKHQLDQVQQLDGAVPAKTPDGKPTQPSALVQVSQDRQVAQGMVTFNYGKDGWNKLPDLKDKIKTIVGVDGAKVYVAGPGGQAADSAAAFAGIDGKLLYSTIIVVVVILLLTYRSPLLWLLPVVSAGVALTCAQAVIYLLAKHADLTVNGQSAGILTVLVFGAGTDYALLLVARYREELHRHEDRHEAMAFALHRATPAIIASALTVVLGMLCLVFADMNSTAGLGPVAAIGIGVGLLVMITLLPALLVIFGRWIFWPRRPAYDTVEPSSAGFWARVGARIAPRPRLVWVGHRRGARGVQPRVPAAQRPRSGHEGRLHQGLRLRDRSAGARRPRAGRHLVAGPGRRQRRPGRRPSSRRCRASPASVSRRRRSSRAGWRWSRRRWTPTRPRRRRSRPSTGCAMRSTRSRAPTRSWVAARRSVPTSSPPRRATTR